MKRTIEKIVLLVGVILYGSGMEGMPGRGSVDSLERPKRNYCGIIEMADGTTFHFTSLSFGSRLTIDHIPVYRKPKNKQGLPQDDKTELDLGLIAEIIIPIDQKAMRYDLIDYFEIEVRFKDEFFSNPIRYLVETTRIFMCDEVKGSLSVPRQLKIPALSKITIEGVRAQDVRVSEPLNRVEDDLQKKQQCTQVIQALRSIEQETKKLPKKERRKVAKLTEVARDGMGALCAW